MEDQSTSLSADEELALYNGEVQQLLDMNNNKANYYLRNSRSQGRKHEYLEKLITFLDSPSRATDRCLYFKARASLIVAKYYVEDRRTYAERCIEVCNEILEEEHSSDHIDDRYPYVVMRERARKIIASLDEHEHDDDDEDGDVVMGDAVAVDEDEDEGTDVGYEEGHDTDNDSWDSFVDELSDATPVDDGSDIQADEDDDDEDYEDDEQPSAPALSGRITGVPTRTTFVLPGTVSIAGLGRRATREVKRFVTLIRFDRVGVTAHMRNYFMVREEKRRRRAVAAESRRHPIEDPSPIEIDEQPDYYYGPPQGDAGDEMAALAFRFR